MSLTIKGKVEKVLPLASGVSSSGNEWVRQEVVLLTADGQYQRRCVVSVMGRERIDKFALTEGERVTCHIDIDAREFKERWFNTISVWKVEHEEGRQEQPQRNYVNAEPAAASPTESDSDDLPF